MSEHCLPLSDDVVLAEVHRLGFDARVSTLQATLIASQEAQVSVAGTAECARRLRNAGLLRLVPGLRGR